MTALREAGLTIVVAILSTVGLLALMASFGVIEDLWTLLTRSVSRRLDPQPPQPATPMKPTTPPIPTTPPPPIPTESEASMSNSDSRDDEPTPIPTPTPTAKSLEQIAVEAESAAEKANQKALFAGHDNAAMPLRIGAMERELERLQLIAEVAGRSAETARDHRQAADYAFLCGESKYSVPEDDDGFYTQRRWRLTEQAKASETSREIESDAAREAVQRMTRKVDELKAQTDRVDAKANLASDEAKAARHLAKLARAAAAAAADVTA